MEEISTPIQTNASFLKVYQYPNNDLLNRCIKSVFNKLSTTRNRHVGFFTDNDYGDYTYNGELVARSQRLTPELTELLTHVNGVFSSDHDGIIINRYCNGSNFISRHSDSKNHADIGVMIISYGAKRNFRVFDKVTNNLVATIPLIHGQMIHMGGDFQVEFTHDVPPDFSVTTPRYSISFHKYRRLGMY